MKRIIVILALVIGFLSCKAQIEPTEFSEAALNDTFVTLSGDNITFKDILETYKGQTIVIDVWASWCKDCVGGMPKVKALQEANTNVTYVFLSLDKSQEAWKKGIEKYNVVGNHYFMQSGWKGAFGEFIQLDWIPRYIVVDKTGNIALFKAIEADDNRIKNIL
ncbi:TlpA family protein disulfide reductase [Siansivirga zeaxanthinifaciens]|uniref:Alkyl hydroperoxide reductase n=1 Tax=Siansivirga zeaxanthinifaciens CC-SAMT-1 TaxID=1454006 RepID=A0A0C5VWP2_9FLAO|nr:TlpA disulfide reductase family protein [Siansivirga zeaxanthinifaciens]AJR03541.1 alkyl hydroperoxide reductase [Siansivirga zeaxanthinifaciens CC-SAMT-1]